MSRFILRIPSKHCDLDSISTWLAKELCDALSATDANYNQDQGEHILRTRSLQESHKHASHPASSSSGIIIIIIIIIIRHHNHQVSSSSGIIIIRYHHHLIMYIIKHLIRKPFLHQVLSTEFESELLCPNSLTFNRVNDRAISSHLLPVRQCAYRQCHSTETDLDCKLAMISHINTILLICFLRLHRLRKLRQLYSKTATHSLNNN